jgi:hypothetical protein
LAITKSIAGGAMAKQQTMRVVHVCACRSCQQHPRGALACEHRRINRLLATADERMRRLLAGFLARQHGRGGVSLLARVTGLDRNTITRGLRELGQGHPHASPRVRHPGAGRPRAEKKVRAS